MLSDFWSSTSCSASLPSLVKLNKDFSRDEFVLIGISSDSNKAQWEQFIHTKGMDAPESWDKEAEVQIGRSAVAAEAVPEHFPGGLRSVFRWSRLLRRSDEG